MGQQINDRTGSGLHDELGALQDQLHLGNTHQHIESPPPQPLLYHTLDPSHRTSYLSRTTVVYTASEMSGIPETFASEPAQAAPGGSEWAPKTTSSVNPPLGTESVTSTTDMNPTTAQLVGEKPEHDFAAADPLAPKDSPLPTPGPELPGAFPASQQGEAAGEAGSLGIASAASKALRYRHYLNMRYGAL